MPSALTTLAPLTGIAERVSVLAPRSDTPLWQVIVQLAEVKGRDAAPGVLGLVGASDVSRRGAITRAAGEAVERWALRPQPHCEDEERLVTASSPVDGDRAEIPLAALLYDAEEPRAGRAPSADERSPSGAAAGGSPTAATASALLELVERDALLVAWARQLSLARVDPLALPRSRGAVDRLRHPLAATGGDIVVADLGTDVPGVHTIVAVCTDRSTGAGAVGARAAIDLDDAVVGAVREAVQALHLARTLRAAGRVHAPTVVRTEEDRAAYWAADGALDHLERWISGFRAPPARRPTGLSEPSIGSVASLLGRAGLHPFVVDLSDRLPEAARGLGWHAVKAVCAQLQPLRIDETRESSWRPDRLSSAEQRTGCSSPLAPGEVCDVPHPLV